MKGRNFFIYSIVCTLIVLTICLGFYVHNRNSNASRFEPQVRQTVEQTVAAPSPPHEVFERGKWEALNFDNAKQEQISVWLYTFENKRYLFVTGAHGMTFIEHKGP